MTITVTIKADRTDIAIYIQELLNEMKNHDEINEYKIVRIEK